MAEYIKSERFIEIALAFQQNLDAMLAFIQSDINPQATKKDLKRRLLRYRLKGLLPLDSGNRVSAGEVLKSTSTLYDENGQIRLQWIKSDVDKNDH